jgi:hypothetical protein
VAAALALLAVGCGGNGSGEIPPGPAPVRVTASISADRVSVKPERFGPGPVSLVVTNRTRTSQQVTLRADGGAALRQETAPINPRDSATLHADMGSGRYTVGVGADRIMPAILLVAGRAGRASKDRLQP